jgi:hypothetical protein
MDTTHGVTWRMKYCGQMTKLRTYLHDARFTPVRALRVRIAIGEHRATCIRCGGPR